MALKIYTAQQIRADMHFNNENTDAMNRAGQVSTIARYDGWYWWVYKNVTHGPYPRLSDILTDHFRDGVFHVPDDI